MQMPGEWFTAATSLIAQAPLVYLRIADNKFTVSISVCQIVSIQFSLAPQLLRSSNDAVHGLAAWRMAKARRLPYVAAQWPRQPGQPAARQPLRYCVGTQVLVVLPRFVFTSQWFCAPLICIYPLQGQFPSTLARLPKLAVLDMKNNNFTCVLGF